MYVPRVLTRTDSHECCMVSDHAEYQRWFIPVGRRDLLDDVNMHLDYLPSLRRMPH